MHVCDPSVPCVLSCYLLLNVLQPEVMVFFLQCLRQNSFTCGLGKCGGHASFARWIFKFISRIRIVVVVVVIFVIELGSLDVRIHAKKKKNIKVFFGFEYLGSFFGGINNYYLNT